MERLRFSRAEIDATVEAVRQHMAFKDVQHMRVAKLKRFMARPWFEDELELHRVDCTGSHGMLDNHVFLRAKQEEFAREPLIPEAVCHGARPDRIRDEARPENRRVARGGADAAVGGRFRGSGGGAGLGAW